MDTTRQDQGPHERRARLRFMRIVARTERMLRRYASVQRSLSISVGEQALSVDTELVALAAGTQRVERTVRDSVIMGIAWQVKALGDLGQIRYDSGRVPPAEGRPDACLIFDLALGRTLETELAGALERRGLPVEARWFEVLASFLGGISRRCEELRSHLGPDGRGAALRLATAIRGSGGLGAYLEQADSAPAPASSTARRARKTYSRRAVPMLAALLALALITHALLYSSSWFAGEPEGVFELADFSAIPGVVELEDCPPSVLLTVRGGTWRGLDGEGRRELLDRARTIVRSRAYQGVLLSTETGDVVGQWATHSGIVLFEPE